MLLNPQNSHAYLVFLQSSFDITVRPSLLPLQLAQLLF